ncbi:cystathionine beta-lyase [Sphingomonas daechungensis]|uniref:Cystathionine beta-lyase n=1 Tax=Sphingomonas daechungensis TaxID=1176646 RepID=A0ABX6SZG0_9SPHN|nr:cystathionine beta-lyase [Sphingomonas daechungensis]QNP42835.1 cystathionine beta-lyase [Sphingomonas daechungensis]
MANDKHPDTKVVQGGRRKEWLRNMVNVPVSRTSTVLFDNMEASREAYPPVNGRLSYGRNGTWTQWSLAEALTELEPGAEGTMLFPSGSAAVSIALTSVLAPGDELLMVDSTYGPTRHFCDRELKRLNVSTVYYDPLSSPAEIEALIGEKTRAVFMESPGSLTFEVQDVPGICAMAKARGLSTLLDNTWATSFFFTAIDKGVDLSVVACTKYISGHSDVMMGAVTAATSHMTRLTRTSRSFGQYVSPDDAYLVARGLRTLGARLRQHELGAVKVAHWLKDQPQVARVIHPAFADCPGHAFWKRDFTGSTGLFSVALKGGSAADLDRLIDSLELFGIGYSWGGFESLAMSADTDNLRTAALRDYGGPLLRLHIGLEDPDDLIADLSAALADYPAA